MINIKFETHIWFLDGFNKLLQFDSSKIERTFPSKRCGVEGGKKRFNLEEDKKCTE